MTTPRKTSDTSEFPAHKAGARICYIEVTPDGGVAQLRYADELRDGLQRAKSGDSRVYAAWPGQYRTDLFEVDS